MVFENITLIELHLENSRFSASRNAESGWTTESEEYDADEYEESAEEESGGRSLGRVFGFLLFVAIAGFAVRRYRSGGDDGGDEVGVDEAEGITIEQAAEQ